MWKRDYQNRLRGLAAGKKLCCLKVMPHFGMGLSIGIKFVVVFNMPWLPVRASANGPRMHSDLKNLMENLLVVLEKTCLLYFRMNIAMESGSTKWPT